jgi:hypothetical protein
MAEISTTKNTALKITWLLGTPASHQREGGQGDRHGPLQPHPGEEGQLPEPEAETGGGEQHGDRPGHQDQHQGDQQPLAGHAGEAAGETEQPQHHEQHDLAQPGGGVVEEKDAAVKHNRTAAQHDAGDVHR